MNEAEARERCVKLAEESPDRETHSWVARKGEGGSWSVIKLAVPSPGASPSATSTGKEEMAVREDPRSPFRSNAGPGGYGF